MTKLDQIADETLEKIKQAGTYRRMRVLDGEQGTRMKVDGREVLLFSGSNYLALAAHPLVVEAAERAAKDYGCASGGSRLINGNSILHEELEARLADLLGTESTLCFNTGYMANVGILPAFTSAGDVIVSDALNHASIIDGCRLSAADTRVFPHGDVRAAEKILNACDEEGRRAVLIVDGIYSMDGDFAPLKKLTDLAQRTGTPLILDDAHGTGTLGQGGGGSAEHFDVSDQIDLQMGTLGKALGSFGAFVAGSKKARDLLVNTARSFIFSCALPPPQVAASIAAVSLIAAEPGRRWALQNNANRLRSQLIKTGLSSQPSETHIVPVIVGKNETTMLLGQRLLDRGYFVQGIRFPSVPEGTARLRITPMATHTEAEIDGLVKALSEEWDALELSR